MVNHSKMVLQIAGTHLKSVDKLKINLLTQLLLLQLLLLQLLLLQLPLDQADLVKQSPAALTWSTMSLQCWNFLCRTTRFPCTLMTLPTPLSPPQTAPVQQ